MKQLQNCVGCPICNKTVAPGATGATSQSGDRGSHSYSIYFLRKAACLPVSTAINGPSTPRVEFFACSVCLSPPAPILGDPQKLLHAMVHPHLSRRSLHSISHVVDCISAHLLHRKRPRQDALHCSYCARLLSTRVYAEHISDFWNAQTSQWREVSPGLPIEPDHQPYFG